DDTSGVMATLAPDAVLMPAGQYPLATPAAIRSFWWPSDGSSTTILAFSRVIDEIGGNRGGAFMRGTDSVAFRYTKGSASSQQSSRSMTLAFLERQSDGAWRIKRMMWANRSR